MTPLHISLLCLSHFCHCCIRLDVRFQTIEGVRGLSLTTFKSLGFGYNLICIMNFPTKVASKAESIDQRKTSGVSLAWNHVESASKDMAGNSQSFASFWFKLRLPIAPFDHGVANYLCYDVAPDCIMYLACIPLIQRGPKVTFLVARSTRGRCAQHLRRIRGCDARIRRESGAYDVNKIIVHSSRTSCKCCAHQPRATRDVTFCPLCIHVSSWYFIVIHAPNT
jgi:hypothetical protein